MQFQLQQDGKIFFLSISYQYLDLFTVLFISIAVLSFIIQIPIFFCTAMRSTHEETVARLRSEWEIEQEKLLAEIKEISDNIERRIQEEVEVDLTCCLSSQANK